MDESTKSSPCKECDDGVEGLQLHAEVEHLRQHLAERDAHIVALEGEFIKCTNRANGLEEQVNTWREKYERLYDSHKRVQKLNQVLEDKLLQMVDKMKGEKSQLTKDIATLSVRLAESKHNFSMLQKENERYKNDMNLAIQLLQCKPDNFVSQKLDNLPVDTQARVSQYVMSKTAKPASSTLPKTGNELDTFDASEYEFNISASLMSKILEDSIQDTVTKHCDTCTCNKSQNKPFCYNESYYSVATQTAASGDVKYTLCFVCNQEIKSLKSNSSVRSISPPGVKIRDRSPQRIKIRERSPQGVKIRDRSPQGIKIRDRSPQGIKIRDRSPQGIKIRDRSPQGIKIRDRSPQSVKIRGRSPNRMIHPLYILPQVTPEHVPNDQPLTSVDKSNSIVVNEDHKFDEKHVITVEPKDMPDGIPKLDDSKIQRPIHKNNVMSMEPAVHHKLCDRTKMSVSMSSKKSSIPSIAKDEPFDVNEVIINHVEVKPASEIADTGSLRKMSQSSMGAISRTSSIAKSTVSTHKSNTQVGPGPRFCHLRMQAGSKNILLDNAEPDVPPVLYRRQSKCNENSLFKELTEDTENFIPTDKNEKDHKDDIKNDNVVVESTLIDVHVDNNYKETNSSTKTTSINPVLMNVSSSPLQPLKTHNFSNSSENNNNKSQSIGSHPNTSELDNLLSDFNADMSNVQNNNSTQITEIPMKTIASTPTDNHDVKIFNFDRYEQNKLAASQYSKPLRKIDMSQLHSLENTRISKDLPPQGNMPKLDKKADAPKANLPPIVNVYPNLTQTHLKVNDNKKAFTNEQSTSSLSSDDSAALLQKQQLLRVAEWVEKNLEQQNNFNDPLDEDVNFNRGARRDSKLNRLTETLNELALNMPHPVSKYSKSYRDAQNWIHAAQNHDKGGPLKITGNVIKETIFPVESGDATVTEISKDTANNNAEEYKAAKDLRDSFAKGDKEISPEDLARMEYNVKKFLLSGPHWANPGAAVRSRRTSSKTETDV